MSLLPTHKKLVEPNMDVWNLVREAKGEAIVWSKADRRIRDLVEKNRAALAIWREGCERPDALYYQPAKLRFGSIIGLITDASLLARLALFEALRHVENGEMEEAWVWYRCALRCSRLVGRHGCAVLRHFGARIHELTASCIVRWADDPRVDARMLRRALDDTLATDALTSPVSEMLKLVYLMCMRELEEPLDILREMEMPGGKGGLRDQVVSPQPVRFGFQRFRLRAANDPEKSRRAQGLVRKLAGAGRPAAVGTCTGRDRETGAGLRG